MFIVIGTTTTDLFICGLGRMPGFDGDEFTTSSLTFCDKPLTMVLGGNGAISAYALAALGAQAGLCSAAGQDALGDIVTGWLQERGVDLRGFVRHPVQATATTTVVMDADLNRMAFYHPGALEHVSYDDIPSDLLEKAKVLLVSSYPILPRFRPEGFANALHLAHQNGAITALDIGPAIGQPAKLEELRPLLPRTDYFIANEHELSVCTGSGDLSADIDQLSAAGAKNIVIKRGKDGAIGRGADGIRVDVPGFAVEAQVTVGAGDSFNAGFLYGVQQGWDLAQAIRFGNATAALVVSSERGVLGCPSLEQVEALVNK